jgi:hypothetical protein
MTIKNIHDLPLNTSPGRADEVESQVSGGGSNQRSSIANILALLLAADIPDLSATYAKLAAANTFTAGPQQFQSDAPGHAAAQFYANAAQTNGVDIVDVFAKDGSTVLLGIGTEGVVINKTTGTISTRILSLQNLGTEAVGITPSAVLLGTGVVLTFNTTTGQISFGGGPILAGLATNILQCQNWLQQSGARARLTANVTNATASMANLSDLSLTLIAGRKYTGRLILFAKNSTAAEGLQFDFNGGTATMTSFQTGFAATPPGSGLVLGTLTTTALGTALTATTATTADAVYTIEISMVVNAGGTFIPRFAEVSHTNGTATVELGSYLWMEDSPN